MIHATRIKKHVIQELCHITFIFCLFGVLTCPPPVCGTVPLTPTHRSRTPSTEFTLIGFLMVYVSSLVYGGSPLMEKRERERVDKREGWGEGSQ